MRPSLDEVRARAHPPGLLDRYSGEHWAGRLYMRDVSLRVTRRIVDAPVSPNQLTVAMIVVGVAAAAVVVVPGVAAAVAAAALIQAYLLLDCVDGELARWRRTTSNQGVYLDRLGHYTVEAALGVGLGLRAGGLGWEGLAIGATAALGIVFGKLESDLVEVARGPETPQVSDTGEASLSRLPLLRTLRGWVAMFPFHRLVGAVELSLAIAVVAVVDAMVTVDLTAMLALVVVGIAWFVALLHPVTILTSRRLG